MAITIDAICDKVFREVENGFDPDEVNEFLDEILDEMENREAEAIQLNAQIAALKQELDEARAALAARPAAAPVAQSAPAMERRSTESFELVLSKAKGAYEEIVAAADLRAEEIIAKANEDAEAIRGNAELQISDLTAKLASLRQQSSEYYDSVKKIVEAQTATMDQLKKLL